jgi:hypothetical protein
MEPKWNYPETYATQRLLHCRDLWTRDARDSDDPAKALAFLNKAKAADELCAEITYWFSENTVEDLIARFESYKAQRGKAWTPGETKMFAEALGWEVDAVKLAIERGRRIREAEARKRKAGASKKGKEG